MLVSDERDADNTHGECYIAKAALNNNLLAIIVL